MVGGGGGEGGGGEEREREREREKERKKEERRDKSSNDIIMVSWLLAYTLLSLPPSLSLPDIAAE